MKNKGTDKVVILMIFLKTLENGSKLCGLKHNINI